MALQDLYIKNEYRSLLDNVTADFYVPLLREAVSYKRAVGFFSSTALIEISKGIAGLVNNGGNIQIVASPYLSSEDIEAIQRGYESRERIIENALINGLTSNLNICEEDRLNLLANLIAEDVLDIKIALTGDKGKLGMYHEKVGIISDKDGNSVVFSGSMNESATAITINYETIDVFCSWNSDNARVISKKQAFEKIWGNKEKNITTFEFPIIKDEIIKRYKKRPPNFYIDNTNFEVHDTKANYVLSDSKNLGFRIPTQVKLYEYQKEAIDNWIKNSCQGIFDMATGSGKTYTALGALSILTDLTKNNLATIIVAPYQHLVEQWVEDIQFFGVMPIIAYSKSSDKKWKERFSDVTNAFNVGVIQNFCIVTTNGSFATNKFQNILHKIKRNICIVIDEAHNFGSENLRKLLPKNCIFRLALSATIERHRDEEGTVALKEYFGEICKKFTLKDAIKSGFLTGYYYYPILVFLTDEELEEYQTLTKKIIKNGGGSKENCEKNPCVELLLLKRSRIIAGAHNKVEKLMETIKPYINDSHMLIYCGATKYERNDIDDEQDIKQIEEVTRLLNQIHGFKVRKFTSNEGKSERQDIINMFSSGEDLQVITAIKCLDEGVNIPAIKRAFILASSTNPKEYIQRRGRVLRKSEGKEFAEIFDFITLPRSLDELYHCDPEILKFEYPLIRRELERMMDFAETARNPFQIDSVKEKILYAYGVYNILEGEIIDE